MGACRESFSIRAYWSRWRIGMRQPRVSLVWIFKDTRDDVLYATVCKWFGHKAYSREEYGEVDWLCSRCHRYCPEPATPAHKDLE